MRGSVVKKKLDSFDKDLLKLFGINFAQLEKSKVRYGPGLLFDLNIEQERSSQEEQPKSTRKMSLATMRNLAYHYRYMDWVQADMSELLRLHGGKIKQNTIRMFNAAYKDSVEAFEQQRVNPLRNLLWEWGFLFYCIPETVMASDENDSAFMVQGKKTLCVLPRRACQLLHEADILRLAPAVLWTIKMRCSFKLIRTPEQLLQELDEWPRHFASHAMFQWWEEIREINPGLVGSRDNQIAG